MRRDIILTGIPRSGTTLAAALLDAMPDTVCLHEPLSQIRKFPSGEAFAHWLADDFADLRKKLLSGAPVENRQAQDGGALTNYYRRGEKPEENFNLRAFTREGLSDDFTLAVKHNAPYLAILDELVKLQHFTVIALIRNPVDVIYSWRTLDIPVSRGELPAAMPYWPRMAKIVHETPDLLERQVKMYDAMCRRIARMKDRIHVLCYESLIENPGQLLSHAGLAGAPPSSLIEKPSRQIPKEERSRILSALEAHGEAWREFYPDLAA